MQKEVEVPVFKIEKRNGGIVLTISRSIRPFAHIKRYESIITYQIFNNGYSIAIIGSDCRGLFFSIIETKGVFRTMTEYVEQKLNTEEQPLNKKEIDIRQHRLNPGSIYFIYLGINGKYYIFDMQGYFGCIEEAGDKFNLTINGKGFYRHLSKPLLDNILSLLLH